MAARRDRWTRGLAGTALAVLLISLSTAGLRAQTDERWTPFLGCWEPIGEVADAGARDGLLCFQPHSGEGVEMISVEDGEIAGREIVVADGQPRDASLEGCSGWERGDFSARPGRLFLSSQYVCEGDVTRKSTALLALVSRIEWIDARTVEAEGETLTWVTRYRLATRAAAAVPGLEDATAELGMAVQSARVAGAARPTVDDLIEASGYVDAPAIEAWLVERDARLDLDADELIRLADAGVSEDVIDMAIAVSFPERFAVDREADRYGAQYGGRAYVNPYFDPYYGSLFYGTYGFGYGYGYGYPYRYGYGGRYYGPVVVRVDRGNDSGGRVIAGQGYSRGTSSASGRQPSSGSVGRSSGSASRGSVGGSSGRSTRGSTGRTARRRGGGS